MKRRINNMAREITQLHPRLQQKVIQLKEACAKVGLTIGISECLRSTNEQEALYAQGRTKPGNIVTNARGTSYSSQHQWGVAFDFYRNDGTGAYNESGQFFDKVGAVGKSLGLGWGGDWTSIKDKPHFYLPDWGSTTSALRNQYGTPTAFMATWGKASIPAKPPASGTTPPPTSSSTSRYSRKNFIIDIQAAIGSKQDGIVGSETLGNTITISRKVNKNHQAITPLERYLKALGYYSGSIEADGGKTPCFGSGMETAVNRYQKEVLYYKKCDGEITKGKGMWRSLFGM
jgi:peptidoglycan L-alanyl-D-glutamate endopeptidase CwlK